MSVIHKICSDCTAEENRRSESEVCWTCTWFDKNRGQNVRTTCDSACLSGLFIHGFHQTTCNFDILLISQILSIKRHFLNKIRPKKHLLPESSMDSHEPLQQQRLMRAYAFCCMDDGLWWWLISQKSGHTKQVLLCNKICNSRRKEHGRFRCAPVYKPLSFCLPITVNIIC